MKLLLIEDEPKTAQTLKLGLEENHYNVDLAYDGQMGLLLAKRNKYDVIISDIILPGINGLDLCDQLRKGGNNTPILLLTALGQTNDKVAGFDSGADDYLVKPFEFNELLARIRSLMKRSQNVFHASNKISFSDLEMNLDTKELSRAGKKIDLTAKEFALMEYFIRNQGRVVSKADIAEKVWDINFDQGTNVIEVYINYLRKKIDKEFPKKLIHTRVGMGYILKEE